MLLDKVLFLFLLVSLLLQSCNVILLQINSLIFLCFALNILAIYNKDCITRMHYLFI